MRLPRRATRPGVAAPGATPAAAAGALADRERLTERFALMQSELGGLFYEMAIRDHVVMEVLIEKAAALQRVDAQLAQIEHLIADGPGQIGGHCERCGTAYAPGAAFCSQCAAAIGAA